MERINEIAQRQARAIGVNLIKVEYKPQGKHTVLRIVIEREGGTGIQDCETVSRAIEQELDVLLLMPGRYSLEVMSRGIR